MSMGMQEVDEASTFIKEHGHKEAEIIWGAAINQDFDDQIMITVIATGFEDFEEDTAKSSAESISQIAKDNLKDFYDTSNLSYDSKKDEKDETEFDSDFTIEENDSIKCTDDLNVIDEETFDTNDNESIIEENEPSILDLNSNSSEDLLDSSDEGVENTHSENKVDFLQKNDEVTKSQVYLAYEDESIISKDNLDQSGLKTTEPLKDEINSDGEEDISTLNQVDGETGAFEDLPIDIYSSPLIDAKNYSIDSLNSSNPRLDNEENNDSNTYPTNLSDKDDDSETSKVETSPLIPEWANQTENPAFFQNLDIPTFLRRRSSNRP